MYVLDDDAFMFGESSSGDEVEVPRDVAARRAQEAAAAKAAAAIAAARARDEALLDRSFAGLDSDDDDDDNIDTRAAIDSIANDAASSTPFPVSGESSKTSARNAACDIDREEVDEDEADAEDKDDTDNEDDDEDDEEDVHEWIRQQAALLAAKQRDSSSSSNRTSTAPVSASSRSTSSSTTLLDPAALHRGIQAEVVAKLYNSRMLSDRQANLLFDKISAGDQDVETAFAAMRADAEKSVDAESKAWLAMYRSLLEIAGESDDDANDGDDDGGDGEEPGMRKLQSDTDEYADDVFEDDVATHTPSADTQCAMAVLGTESATASTSLSSSSSTPSVSDDSVSVVEVKQDKETQPAKPTDAPSTGSQRRRGHSTRRSHKSRRNHSESFSTQQQQQEPEPSRLSLSQRDTLLAALARIQQLGSTAPELAFASTADLATHVEAAAGPLLEQTLDLYSEDQDEASLRDLLTLFLDPSSLAAAPARSGASTGAGGSKSRKHRRTRRQKTRASTTPAAFDASTDG